MNRTKINTTLITFLIVLISANLLFADSNKNIRSPRAKERMDMVKKMKMIETMELDEAKSEKFLAKFNDYSRQLEEKKRQQKDLVHKLNDAVKNNSKEVSAISEQLLNSKEELNRIIIDKTREMRNILSETEFAKYLVFENKFMREVFNCFMHHNGDGMKKDGKKMHKEMRENGEKTRKELRENGEKMKIEMKKNGEKMRKENKQE